MVLSRRGEDDAELAGDACGEEAWVTASLQENMLPPLGPLDRDTLDTYMAADKGLVWSLFPPEEGGLQFLEARRRPMMAEVARLVKGLYFVTYIRTWTPPRSRLSMTCFTLGRTSRSRPEWRRIRWRRHQKVFSFATRG